VLFLKMFRFKREKSQTSEKHFRIVNLVRVLLFFFLISFIHMCIQCLGHFSPLSPAHSPYFYQYINTYQQVRSHRLFVVDSAGISMQGLTLARYVFHFLSNGPVLFVLVHFSSEA
jgi:hypothetical protein